MKKFTLSNIIFSYVFVLLLTLLSAEAFGMFGMHDMNIKGEALFFTEFFFGMGIAALATVADVIVKPVFEKLFHAVKSNLDIIAVIVLLVAGIVGGFGACHAIGVAYDTHTENVALEQGAVLCHKAGSTSLKKGEGATAFNPIGTKDLVWVVEDEDKSFFGSFESFNGSRTAVHADKGAHYEHLHGDIWAVYYVNEAQDEQELYYLALSERVQNELAR